MGADPRIMQTLDALQAGLDELRASLAPATTTVHVSLKDAARRLGLHERTVRRYAKRGAGIMIGGRWRIDLSQLQRGRP